MKNVICSLLLVAAVFVPAAACFAAGGPSDVPTPDDIFNMLGGNSKGLDLNSLRGKLIYGTIDAIRFLQTFAVPTAVAVVIIAGIVFGLGALRHDTSVKRLAVNMCVGALIGLMIAKLAPIIVAGVFHALE